MLRKWRKWNHINTQLKLEKAEKKVEDIFKKKKKGND